MRESAATYLERRTATAFARVTAIARALPERLAATEQREEVGRLIVGHPWLVLGGTFAATTLLSRSLFASDSRGTPAPSSAAEAPSRRESDSTREAAAQGSILGALFMPLAALASRALIEGFLADVTCDDRAGAGRPDASNPPEANDVV